jgi:uncharacterized protein (DUF3084 family)
MSAVDLRAELGRLTAERLDALDAGLEANALYMEQLTTEIEAHRAAYVGAAVTEIAVLRGQLSGAQQG